MLADHEPRRPKQASLRRAISAAYYAVFHLLTSEAAARLVKGAARRPLRDALRRAYNHGEMRLACADFCTSTGGQFSAIVGSAGVPADLQVVAQAFRDLQQARHEADYDVSRTFTRGEALDVVALAEQAFSAWRTARATAASDAFLTVMLARKGMLR
jgi:hypothetical protein